MSGTPSDSYKFKTFRETSRLLTIIENELEGADDILKSLELSSSKVIGITGPPGAGKSSLVKCFIDELIKENKRIAVLAVDPTSPFNFGSLLGDRIRMQKYSTHPNVYIRSVATRGALGGLAPKIIEMADVLKSSGFNYIIIETVGVGQSEVEIAGLADITLLALVPESGDEVQSIKAGIMEIADAFIVNKAEREGADRFVKTLECSTSIKVFKTVATTCEGVKEIIEFIRNFEFKQESKFQLMLQKAWRLIQEKRMRDIDKQMLQYEITEALNKPDFNLYKFVESKIKNS